MNLAHNIKEIRKQKAISQKQIAIEVGIDQAQYSRVESGKVEPTITSLTKIAKALGVKIVDFFSDSTPLKEVHSYDKDLLERLQLLDQLDDNEKKSICSIIDIAISKKKLKDYLANAINLAS